MIILSTEFNKQIENKEILFWYGILSLFYQYSYILSFLPDEKKIKQQQQYNRLIEIQYSKIEVYRYTISEFGTEKKNVLE